MFLKSRILSMCCVCLTGIFVVGCGGGDLTPPGYSLTNSFPQHDAEDIGVREKIWAEFSDSIDPKDINNYTFSVMEEDSMSLVEGKISYDAATRKVTFEPYMPLPYDTNFHVTVSNMIRNTSGKHLDQSHNWVFTTLEHPENFSFSPDDNAVGINPKTVIRVQFQHAANETSIQQGTTFKVYPTTNPTAVVAGEIEYDEYSHALIFWPGDSLDLGQQYTYELTTGITKESDSSPMFTANTIKTFTTSASQKTTNVLGSSSEDYSYAVDIASNGSVVVAGETWGWLVDDTNSESGDGFIAVYDSFGEELNIHQFGSTDIEAVDAVYDMEMDSADNIYVTGYTTGSLDNGVHSGNSMFIGKFSLEPISGVVTQQWMKQIDTSENFVQGWALAVDATGVYVVGQGRGGVAAEQAKGNYDIVVAKYSTSGNQEWLKVLGTAAGDYPQGIAVSNSFVYVGGDTLGDFADAANQHKALAPFILQLDKQTGSTNWSQLLEMSSSSADETLVNIAVSGEDVYAVGNVRDQTGTSLFLTGYSANQTQLPVTKKWGETTADDERATSIFISTDNSIFVGSTRFHLVSGQMHGMTQIYKVSTQGADLWSPNGQGQLVAGMHASVRGMKTDSLGNLHATGFVHGGMDGAVAGGLGDVFVSKLDVSGYSQ